MAKRQSIELNMIELFSSLTREEVSSLNNLLTLKRFKKNEVILYEEDTSKFMYIILSGRVRVIQTAEDGKEILLAIHRAGEFFGEMAFIDGKTSPATIVAAEDSVVSIISKDEFYLTIYAHKQILNNLLLILCSRLRESWGKIQLLNLKNASDRLKILFYMLSNKYGERTSKGITLTIKLTHQEMADMSGMARETVTRVLDKWNKEGEIDILENKLIHLRTDFLQKDFNLST